MGHAFSKCMCLGDCSIARGLCQAKILVLMMRLNLMPFQQDRTRHSLASLFCGVVFLEYHLNKKTRLHGLEILNTNLKSPKTSHVGVEKCGQFFICLQVEITDTLHIASTCRLSH